MAKNKKSKKSKKKEGYSPIKDFVSADLAIIQACSLLDEAAIKAIKSGNTEHMAIVSHGWLEVGGILAGLSERGESETHELQSDHEMGFRGNPAEEEPEDDDIEDYHVVGFRSNNERRFGHTIKNTARR